MSFFLKASNIFLNLIFSLFFFFFFHSFDNVGILKSKLVGLNVDLSDSFKSPGNLVRKSRLLRPLFSVLSLYVVMVEGKNQAVTFNNFANNIAIFRLLLNYLNVIVRASYPDCSTQITFKITQS